MLEGGGAAGRCRVVPHEPQNRASGNKSELQFGQFMIQSNVLHYYPFRFFNDDVRGVFCVVGEIEKCDIVVRHD